MRLSGSGLMIPAAGGFPHPPNIINATMLIGLTYDLRNDYLADGFSEDETAEFDRPDTIDAIENALRTLGHRTERIGHARKLMARLLAGGKWDLVFNIAEGLHGIGRESQVPCILDLYSIPYTFSDPVVTGLTLHKGLAKRVVRDAGVPTAPFTVIGCKKDLEAVDFKPPFFVKPLAEGTGKGVTPKSVVRNLKDLWPRCKELIDLYHQEALVETFLSGREFTTGITGTGRAAKIAASMEVILLPNAEAEVYSYLNKEKCEELVEYRLAKPRKDPVVKEAEAVALAAWRALGCRDAGRVDLRCDSKGRVHFIEVNPLAGLHPEHSDLPILCTKAGISYQELISRIISSAAERVVSPLAERTSPSARKTRSSKRLS